MKLQELSDHINMLIKEGYGGVNVEIRLNRDDFELVRIDSIEGMPSIGKKPLFVYIVPEKELSEALSVSLDEDEE